MAEYDDYTIQPLGFNDLPSALVIERRSFPVPWSLAMFMLELSKPSSVCLVARSSKKLVGYLVCSLYGDAWHLMNVSVDPGYRRLGIASELLKALFDQTGDEAQYTLEVRPSNTAAIVLYQRHGFNAVGRRTRYYQDNGEDAVIMWRTPGTKTGTLADVPNVAASA